MKIGSLDQRVFTLGRAFEMQRREWKDLSKGTGRAQAETRLGPKLLITLWSPLVQFYAWSLASNRFFFKLYLHIIYTE